MTPEGYTEYKRREYCNATKCPIQTELNKHPTDSEAYEKTRKTCATNCIRTTYEFHHWLIDNGYLILKPTKKKT